MILFDYEQIIICDDELCSYYCFNFMVMWPFFACILCCDSTAFSCSYIIDLLCSRLQVMSFVLDYVRIMRCIQFHQFKNQSESTGCFLFNPQDHPGDQGWEFRRPQRAGAGTGWRRRSWRGARSPWGWSGRKWRRTSWRELVPRRLLRIERGLAPQGVSQLLVVGDSDGRSFARGCGRNLSQALKILASWLGAASVHLKIPWQWTG